MPSIKDLCTIFLFKISINCKKIKVIAQAAIFRNFQKKFVISNLNAYACKRISLPRITDSEIVSDGNVKQNCKPNALDLYIAKKLRFA